jgi:hypothetical protein
MGRNSELLTAVLLSPISVRMGGNGDKTDKHRCEREADHNDGNGDGIHSPAVGVIDGPLETRAATCTAA